MGIVKLLIPDFEADFNIQAEVHAIAALRGNTDIAKFLLQGPGMDMTNHLENKILQEALFQAASFNRLDMIRFLILDVGMDVVQHFHSNYNPHGYSESALHRAAYMNNIRILRFQMMESGANVAHKLDKCGAYEEALAEAAESDSLNALKLLALEVPAATSLQLQREIYDSALSNAVKRGHVEIVKFLVKEMDADVNIHFPTDNSGDFTIFGSALATAAAMGHFNNVKCLVEYGQADMNMSLHYGYFGNALAAAVAFSKGTRLEEPGETDSFDRSQEEQIQEQLFENIEYLVKKEQESVNTTLLHGRYGSVLAAAASAGSPECVCYLIREAGADINMPLPHASRGSALAAGAYYGRLDSVKILIKEGASVNLDLGDGRFANALGAAEAEFSEELMYWEPQSNIEEWKEGLAEFLEFLEFLVKARDEFHVKKTGYTELKQISMQQCISL